MMNSYVTEEKTMSNDWIVAVGNFIDGVTFYGPFKNHADALHWAETQTAGEAWQITTLENPDHD